MGFFDKILKTLGFEEESEEKLSKNTKKEDKNTKKVKINSKFDLEESIVEKREQKYKPQTQDEIEKIANDLMSGVDAEIDFSEFAESDRVRALDFLSGVTYAVGGKIEKNNGFYKIKVK